MLLLSLLLACGARPPHTPTPTEGFTVSRPAGDLPLGVMMPSMQQQGDWVMLDGRLAEGVRTVRRLDGTQVAALPEAFSEAWGHNHLLSDGAVVGIEPAEGDAPSLGTRGGGIAGSGGALLSTRRTTPAVVVREADGTVRFRVPLHETVVPLSVGGAEVGAPQVDASRDGSRILAYMNGTAWLLDRDGAVLWTAERGLTDALSLRISPDGTRVVAILGPRIPAIPRAIQERSIEDGAVLAELKEPSPRPAGWAGWAGDELLLGTDSGLARWEADGTWTRCKTDSNAQGILSHQGQTLLWGTSGGVWAWRGCDTPPELLGRVAALPDLSAPDRPLRGLVSDGTHLQAMLKDGNVVPLDADLGLPELLPPRGDGYALAVAPGGDLLVWLGTGWLQPFARGRTTAPVIGHEAFQTSAVFSVDGQLLRLTGGDGRQWVLTIDTWEAASPEEVAGATWPSAEERAFRYLLVPPTEAGGSPQRLLHAVREDGQVARLPPGQDQVWSSDGRWIAYTTRTTLEVLPAALLNFEAPPE